MEELGSLFPDFPVGIIAHTDDNLNDRGFFFEAVLALRIRDATKHLQPHSPSRILLFQRRQVNDLL